MATMDDIAALLDDADEQLAVASKLHDEALDNSEVRNRFKTRVKNVLENLRSSLDYIAVAVTERYGNGKKGPVYYPLAQSEQAYPAEMDRRMPGVATAEPAISDAIKRHQPYRPGYEWLRNLSTLTREQKHNQLTFQLVREVYQCRVTEKATGASVQWQGLRFLPDRIESQGGTIELRPQPDRKMVSPKLFELAGPTGVLVFGIPLDPNTQRPYPNATLDVESGPLHQWCFLKPHVPVLSELRMMRSGVGRAMHDIAESARL